MEQFLGILQRIFFIAPKPFEKIKSRPSIFLNFFVYLSFARCQPNIYPPLKKFDFWKNDWILDFNPIEKCARKIRRKTCISPLMNYEVIRQWNESIFYKWQKSKKFFLWPPSSKKRMPKDRYPPNDKLNETGERKWWKNCSCAPRTKRKNARAMPFLCVCRRKMFSHTISWWIEIKFNLLVSFKEKRQNSLSSTIYL